MEPSRSGCDTYTIILSSSSSSSDASIHAMHPPRLTSLLPPSGMRWSSSCLSSRYLMSGWKLQICDCKCDACCDGLNILFARKASSPSPRFRIREVEGEDQIKCQNVMTSQCAGNLHSNPENGTHNGILPAFLPSYLFIPLCQCSDSHANSTD